MCKCPICMSKGFGFCKFLCKGKYCHTVDQCFREILDVSYTLQEIKEFNKIGR
jgi:hypothetical protein